MFLGIEIGGTKLQLGVGPGDGSALAELMRLDVEPAKGAQGILRQIEEGAGALIARHAVRRIGVGFGGPVDARRGRTIKSHQVEGWTEFPLTEWVQQRLGLPVALGNDCDVAGLAEAHFGAGRGKRVVFYVTVGTGVGGGLIIDGRIHHGSGTAAAEIGHLRPGPEAERPDQTVESIASGWGIEAAARERMGAALTARQLAEVVGKRVASNAAMAGQILQEAVRTLGWAIAQVITLVSPEVVIVGGGVSLMSEALFLEPLRAEVARYVFPPLTGSYRLEPAELGELVVVQGALKLAADAS